MRKNIFYIVFVSSVLIICFAFNYPFDYSNQAKVSIGQCNTERDSLALLELYNATNLDWDINQKLSRWWRGIKLNTEGCVKEFSFKGCIESPRPFPVRKCIKSAIGGGCPGLVLRGAIPNSFFENLPCLEKLTLTCNWIGPLEFTIPSQIGQLESLIELDLSGNNLLGGIPTEIGQLKNLKQLTIENSGLINEIPASIGELHFLEYLNLNRNEFSQSLPLGLGRLTQLKELHIENSNLSGNIPPDLEGLKNLTILNLNRNELSGVIPSTIGELKNLIKLELSFNQLNGLLPSTFGEMENLEDLQLSENQLVGSLPTEWGTMLKLGMLDLANNQLTGVLPVSFKQLTQLETVNLSENEFSLELLKEMPLIENLKMLDCSNNNINGELTDFLKNLPNLTNLILNNNELVGELPSNIDEYALQNLSFANNSIENLPAFKNLISLNIQNNKLTFEDIIPNFFLVKSNTNKYIPQKKIFPDSTFIFNKCETPIINLNIDKDIEDNVYKWYKNGDAISVTNSYQLNLREVFTDFKDYSGIYNCEVTNPAIPGLTLKTGEIILELEETLPIPDTIHIQRELCYGNSTEIAGVLYDCSTPEVFASVPDSISGCPTIYAITINCKTCSSIAESSIPTAFSPNGDGFNETFIIPHIFSEPETYGNNELVIYNVYGREVYKKQNYQNEWNGLDNRDKLLPLGSYYYTLRYGKNLKSSLSGIITLVR